MTLSSRTKYYITEAICLLYILLFIYASTSKLMDFQHFRIQLGQSPLLSAFAMPVAVIVPLTEIFICVLLLIPKWKPVGLFAAYGLMVMFTAYIFIILNYTSFVPCSCGGVLEKLGWQSHLIFNMFFIFLAVLGIILYKNSGTQKFYFVKNKRIIALFSILTISGISTIVVMFIFSENIIHYHNRLTRRFPQTPIEKVNGKDLKLNSFYIAGADSFHIFLGNYTAPLLITTLNAHLAITEQKMIELNRKDLPFQGIRLSVRSPYFFAADGSVPCVFRGRIKNWKAEIAYKGGEYFTTTQALDSVSVAVVTNNSRTGDNVLGIINVGEKKNTITLLLRVTVLPNVRRAIWVLSENVKPHNTAISLR